MDDERSRPVVAQVDAQPRRGAAGLGGEDRLKAREEHPMVAQQVDAVGRRRLRGELLAHGDGAA